MKKVHMKGTIMTFAIITTMIVIWLLLGFIAYLLNDLTFKESIKLDFICGSSLLIGVICCIVVCSDLDDYLR